MKVIGGAIAAHHIRGRGRAGDVRSVTTDRQKRPARRFRTIPSLPGTFIEERHAEDLHQDRERNKRTTPLPGRGAVCRRSSRTCRYGLRVGGIDQRSSRRAGASGLVPLPAMVMDLTGSADRAAVVAGSQNRWMRNMIERAGWIALARAATPPRAVGRVEAR
jgi:hypothetical protein